MSAPLGPTSRTTPVRLVENLRSFDSHERGLLVQWATGSRFMLGDDVRAAISDTVNREIPNTAFVAMDYTLDWLYAATRWTLDPTACGQPQPQPLHGELLASPEDVDMLVAWEDEEGPHLVMLEAKGFTGWSNAQMASKAKRLAAIFPGGVQDVLDVHFILLGPAPSKGLNTQGWPDWMNPGRRAHFLAIDDPGLRRAVQRCDEHGTPRRDGTHWRTVERSWTTAAAT